MTKAPRSNDRGAWPREMRSRHKRFGRHGLPSPVRVERQQRYDQRCDRHQPRQVAEGYPLPGRDLPGHVRGAQVREVDPQLLGQPREVRNQGLGILVTAGRVFHQQPPQHPHHVLGDFRVGIARVGRCVTLVLQQLLQHVAVRERRPSREHEVKRAAQRVNVRGNFDRIYE